MFFACCPRKPKAKSFAFSYSDEQRPTVTDSIQDTQYNKKATARVAFILWWGMLPSLTEYATGIFSNSGEPASLIKTIYQNKKPTMT